MTEQNLTDTDRMLEATLRTRLGHAPGLGNVQATVNHSVAILTGNVGEEVDIKRAVIIAQTVEGLQEVHEELQVVGAPLDEREAYIAPVEEASNYPINSETTANRLSLDEDLNPTTVANEDSLATLVQEGMDVFDSEEKKVGKVKEVRPTDFLLSRLLARNYYVPYIACSLNTDGVHLNIKASEMRYQGWAVPGHQEGI